MNDLLTSDAEFDSLTSATEERATLRAVAEHTDKLGVVIGGSLSEGLEVKLDRDSVAGGAGRGPLRRRTRPPRPLLLHDHRRGARQHQPDDRQAAARRVRPVPGRHLPGHDHLRHGAPQPAAHPGGGQGGGQAGEDRAGALHAGRHRQPGRGRSGVRAGGGAQGRREDRALLPHRRAAGHGERQDHAEPGAAGRAVERRLRQIGHGQDVPLAAAAGRRDPAARGGQPDLRHAQRVRLGGQLGAGEPRQGPQADLPRPGQHLHPGRRIVAAPRLEPRLHRQHRLRPDRAGGPGDAGGHPEPLRAAGGRGVCPLPQVRPGVADQLPG